VNCGSFCNKRNLAEKTSVQADGEVATTPKHVPRDLQALQIDDPAVLKQLTPTDPHRQPKKANVDKTDLAVQSVRQKKPKKARKRERDSRSGRTDREKAKETKMEAESELTPTKSAPIVGERVALEPGYYRWITPQGVLEGVQAPHAHLHLHLPN
jgi:hypothetical protein